MDWISGFGNEIDVELHITRRGKSGTTDTTLDIAPVYVSGNLEKSKSVCLSISLVRNSLWNVSCGRWPLTRLEEWRHMHYPWRIHLKESRNAYSSRRHWHLSWGFLVALVASLRIWKSHFVSNQQFHHEGNSRTGGTYFLYKEISDFRGALSSTP